MKTLIAERAQGRTLHKFGGTSWHIECPVGSSPAPLLIATLALTDHRLDFGPTSLNELPLASRVDEDLPDRQEYEVLPSGRIVHFEGEAWQSRPGISTIAESFLELRDMRGNEDPEANGSVNDSHDTFLGGSGFLRIGGAPLWLGDAETVICGCGRACVHVASVGYENFGEPSGITDGEAFFLGELAAYFFACLVCNRVVVLTQSS